MSRRSVTCRIDEVDIWSEEKGTMVPGVCATCSECGVQTEAWGRSDRSVRRCLALMREECMMDAGNFYEAEGGEDRFSDEEAPLIAAPPPAADTQKPVPTTFSCKIAYNPEHGYWVAWLSDNACSGSSPQSALNNLLKHLGY